MVTVGRIREIWRYPVKGMAGEQLESCPVSERGIEGDRIWALRDVARREVQSCKTRPLLLTCSARVRETGDDQVAIMFPDGSIVGSDDDCVHDRLSALTGKASALEPLRPATDLAFYRRHKTDGYTWFKELMATFDREPQEPLPDFDPDDQDFADFVSRPGTFFLVTPLHLLTTATLHHLDSLNPAGDWDARRFRPNFLIETVEASASLLEQDWVGRRLVIGGLEMDCVAPTPRCGAITRSQRDFAADTEILRTVVNEADQNVGVYGETVTSGVVSVGDTVRLV